MITISKATNKDSLIEEWHKVDVAHYGKPIEWNEKKFQFKAVEDGKLIGTIDGKLASGVVYIDSLITAESSRGKGVGKMLVEKVAEFGRKLKAHRIWLITGKTWKENEFYQKLGFKKIADLPDFHFHTDFVVYTRDI
ncbi:MAG: GNAT family N-acetyltransferase [Microgenomates group bacterium]